MKLKMRHDNFARQTLKSALSNITHVNFAAENLKHRHLRTSPANYADEILMCSPNA